MFARAPSSPARFSTPSGAVPFACSAASRGSVRAMASTGDTILFEVWSIADLRSRSGLARIGRALDADPELRPERLDPRDPPRTPIASAADALAEWRPAARAAARDWDFFANRKTEPRGRGTVQIAAPMPGRVALHSVTCAYPTPWVEPAQACGKLARSFAHLSLPTSD